LGAYLAPRGTGSADVPHASPSRCSCFPPEEGPRENGLAFASGFPITSGFGPCWFLRSWGGSLQACEPSSVVGAEGDGGRDRRRGEWLTVLKKPRQVNSPMLLESPVNVRVQRRQPGFAASILRRSCHLLSTILDDSLRSQGDPERLRPYGGARAFFFFPPSCS